MKKPKTQLDIGPDTREYFRSVFDHEMAVAKERRRRIVASWEIFQRAMESEESKLKVLFSPLPTAYERDYPVEVAECSHIIRWSRYKPKRWSRVQTMYSMFGWKEAVRAAFSRNKSFEAYGIGSIGNFYSEKQRDPTISEAFDSGFYVCVKLLQEGIISLDDIEVDTGTDVQYNSNGDA